MPDPKPAQPQSKRESDVPGWQLQFPDDTTGVAISDDVTDPLGRLRSAARRGDDIQVTKLLNNPQVNVNGGAPYSTPLHEAARRGHSSVVRLLLGRGADTDVGAPDGTPLHIV